MQPELVDRLPDHGAIQWLYITKAPADLDLLFRLKSLFHLTLWFPFHTKLVPRVLEELSFLLVFHFKYDFRCDCVIGRSKQITVSLLGQKR